MKAFVKSNNRVQWPSTISTKEFSTQPLPNLRETGHSSARREEKGAPVGEASTTAIPWPPGTCAQHSDSS